MLFYTTVDEVDRIELEPSRINTQFDIDRDSAMGLSVFTSEKSTTLSEVSLLNYLHIPSTFYCGFYVFVLFFFFTSESSG